MEGDGVNFYSVFFFSFLQGYASKKTFQWENNSFI